MKKYFINALIGLVAVAALILLLADSDSSSALFMSKVIGGGLLYLDSRVYEHFNGEEAV